MSPAAYLPNRDFAGEFLASDQALDLLRPLGPEVREIAKALAPERQGHLIDSIVDQYGFLNGVATCRINAKDFKAGWWEFGHEGRSQPFLRPAAAKVGPLEQGAQP